MEQIVVEPVDKPEEPRGVQIKATLAGKINLADFQNAIPVVHELALANETADDTVISVSRASEDVDI